MFGFFRPSGPQLGRIDLPEAIARAARGDLTVIDVRDGQELRASGKAKGALHVPLAVLQMKLDPRSPERLPGITTETPIGLYCASGARSQGAAQMLLGMGYSQVYNLGGLYHWQMAGGPIEA